MNAAAVLKSKPGFSRAARRRSSLAEQVWSFGVTNSPPLTNNTVPAPKLLKALTPQAAMLPLPPTGRFRHPFEKDKKNPETQPLCGQHRQNPREKNGEYPFFTWYPFAF
jgi:hypothetical protein